MFRILQYRAHTSFITNMHTHKFTHVTSPNQFTPSLSTISIWPRSREHIKYFITHCCQSEHDIGKARVLQCRAPVNFVTNIHTRIRTFLENVQSSAQNGPDTPAPCARELCHINTHISQTHTHTHHKHTHHKHTHKYSCPSLTAVSLNTISEWSGCSSAVRTRAISSAKGLASPIASCSNSACKSRDSMPDLGEVVCKMLRQNEENEEK